MQQEKSLAEQLQIREKQANLQWLSKGYQDKMSPSCLISKAIPNQNQTPDYEFQCNILITNKLQYSKIQIVNCMLIKDKADWVLLSETILKKRKLQHCGNQVFIINISNKQGEINLCFSHPQTQKFVFKKLKIYGVQLDFLKKHKINETNTLNFYQITNRNNKNPQTVQIFNRKQFICCEQDAILKNYLNILRTLDSPNILKINSVYYDQNMIYVVMKHFRALPLSHYLKSQFTLNQQQITSIIYQLLAILKQLQDNEIYHGNINPDTILIDQGQQTILVYLINFHCMQFEKDIDYYICSTVFVAPEVKNNNIEPSIETDIYQVGIVLALLSLNRGQNQKYYDQTYVLENLYDIIKQEEKLFQESKNSNYTMLYSFSQLELIKKMTNPQREYRLSLQDSIKHHWFINMKDKIKDRSNVFPSLRTIIEISEHEINNKSYMQVNQNQRSKFGRKFNPQLSIAILSPHDIQQIENIQETGIFDEEHHLGQLMGYLNQIVFMKPSQMPRMKTQPDQSQSTHPLILKF
ncbi:hypothetical protein pb186bvf_020172 [Paramecium bursaria]